MKRTNIPIYIDLLFCLVIMPPIIMLVPVDRWIVHHTVFMLTLIVYLYGLYFVYRKARLPRLFMQRKFGHILLLMGILVIITLLLTQFPYPPEPNKLDPLIHKARQHLRSQTVRYCPNRKLKRRKTGQNLHSTRHRSTRIFSLTH